jgi:hypothetical protein
VVRDARLQAAYCLLQRIGQRARAAGQSPVDPAATPFAELLRRAQGPEQDETTRV